MLQCKKSGLRKNKKEKKKPMKSFDISTPKKR